MNALSAFVDLIDCCARKQNTEAARECLAPFDVGHLAALRTQPHDVFDSCAPDLATLEKISAAKHRMRLAQRDQALNKNQKPTINVLGGPVELTDLIVLTICVVVAVLRVADCVPGKQHRHTLR